MPVGKLHETLETLVKMVGFHTRTMKNWLLIVPTGQGLIKLSFNFIYSLDKNSSNNWWVSSPIKSVSF